MKLDYQFKTESKNPSGLVLENSAWALLEKEISKRSLAQPVQSQPVPSLFFPEQKKVPPIAKKEKAKRLALAATQGDIPTLQQLHAQKMNFDQCLASNETALSIAIKHRQLRAAKWLVSKGADVYQYNAKGINLLMESASQGDLETVKWLCEQDFYLDEKDAKGKTAVMHASLGNHIGVVKHLSSCGASLHKKDKTGKTALMLASQNGYLELSLWLLKHKGNLWEVDRAGRTALDLADPTIQKRLR